MLLNKGLSVLFLIAISLVFVSGCGTVSGVGKDLQKAGQVIEKEANKK